MERAFDGVEAPKGLSIPWLVAPILGNAADFATTAYVLQHGGVERNPVARPPTKSLPVFAAVKLGLGVVTSVMANHEAKAGHRTRAKLIAGFTTLVSLGPAVHNLVVIRKLK